MKDWLVNAEYDERNRSLLLHGRKTDYELTWPDYFFVRSEEATRFPTDWDEHIEVDGSYARVTWPDPIRVGGSRSGRLHYFHERVFVPRGISPLEADIHPIQRFLIDRPKVRIAEDWRLLWYDLETEMVRDWEKVWKSRILSVSWSSSDGASGHIRSEALTDQAERKLLQDFFQVCARHDILLAWNGSRFDDRVISGRATLLDVDFAPDAYHWLDHLWLFKRYFMRTEDGAVKQSFALDAIAEAFLDQERKLPLEKRAREKGFESGDLFTWTWKNAPDLLREYNDQDVTIMRKLEEKTGFIKLHFSLSRLCRVLPTKSSQYPMTHVDGRMLQQGRIDGYHFPSRIRGTEATRRRARGAYVPEAVLGLHESVAVLDFARMYPSIIRTFNMSLETIDPSGDLIVPDTTPKGRRTGEVVCRFRSDKEGLLPAALRGVLQERKQYSQAQSKAEIGSDAFYDFNRLSTACKILANTFYGVVLSPMSRFYAAEIGESVTSMGRLLLSSTIQAAAKRGHPLVFGDTDSVAIVADDQQAAALKDVVNGEMIPELLLRAGVPPGKGEIEIDYEKRYRTIVVTASKRYAGRFAIYKGKEADPDSPIDIRGLEMVRTDVCQAARRLQRNVVEQVLSWVDPNELWKGIEKIRDAFARGETPSADLVLRKSVTKPIKEYASQPQQVRVAVEMVSRGMEVGVGQKIPFLIARSGPIIPDDLGSAEELDLGYYWNKMVYPPSLRVLKAAYPEIQWEALLFTRGIDPNQLGLFQGGVPLMAKQARKVRKVRKATRGVVLTVPESIDGDQLLEVLRAFPGEHPLRVDVLVRESGRSQLVELEGSDLKIQDPATVQQFGRALRTIGVRWGSSGDNRGDGNEAKGQTNGAVRKVRKVRRVRRAPEGGARTGEGTPEERPVRKVRRVRKAVGRDRPRD